MAKPDFSFSRSEGPAYYRPARYVSRHPQGGRLYLFAWRSLGALIFRLVPSRCFRLPDSRGRFPDRVVSPLKWRLSGFGAESL